MTYVKRIRWLEPTHISHGLQHVWWQLFQPGLLLRRRQPRQGLQLVKQPHRSKPLELVFALLVKQPRSSNLLELVFALLLTLGDPLLLALALLPLTHLLLALLTLGGLLQLALPLALRQHAPPALLPLACKLGHFLVGNLLLQLLERLGSAQPRLGLCRTQLALAHLLKPLALLLEPRLLLAGRLLERSLKVGVVGVGLLRRALRLKDSPRLLLGLAHKRVGRPHRVRHVSVVATC